MAEVNCFQIYTHLSQFYRHSKLVMEWLKNMTKRTFPLDCLPDEVKDWFETTLKMDFDALTRGLHFSFSSQSVNMVSFILRIGITKNLSGQLIQAHSKYGDALLTT